MTPCNLKGCPLPGQHISDCEPTHAGKVTYWGERALVLRGSMERDGLSLEEIGQIFGGAAPTLRPPPMPPEPNIPGLQWPGPGPEDATTPSGRLSIIEGKLDRVSQLRAAEMIDEDVANRLRRSLLAEMLESCEMPRPDDLDELESRDVSSDLKPRGGNL